jgi:glucose/arabinose dehydrogenase
VASLALLGSVGCGGGGGSGGGSTTPAPSGLSYETSPALYRLGVAAVDNDPTVTGTVTTWGIAPALPAGLTLDPVTGTIGGLPTAEAAAADYVITASNAGGQTQTTLSLLVGPPLPPDVVSLPLGFAIDVVASGLATPAKLVLAPDGRIFFNELKTGQVRIIDAAGVLQPTPFLTLTVQGAGSHQGLMGLALAPDFATSGHVFVLFCAPADADHATDHMRLERYTDVAGVGTAGTVILDDLPISAINNGNDLLFDLAGNLFVSLGDAEVPANAQDPLLLTGRVLRLTPTGGIPLDNPTPGNPTWCLGLRNTYGLALHPVTGGLFGVDNGPAADDELNFLQPGKNYGWGAAVPVPGGLAGLRIRVWQTEIVPTAVAWHFGGPWGAEYEDDLFLASYDVEEVLRYEMSGTQKTDVDNDVDHPIFLKLAVNMTFNKPLDLAVAGNGDLYVGTFSTIYRVRKL